MTLVAPNDLATSIIEAISSTARVATNTTIPVLAAST
jgi:hypothetical protein